jgi:predicted phage terminase large subunit-like protein
MTKYIPHKPTPKQQAFLLLDGVLDVFYGGAVGGGKSDALLMAALQYVDIPGYAGLILRSTYKDLNQPDAIMARSKEWLMKTDAKWNEKDTRWTFPGGATLTFGYLDGPNDHFQYQSAAYQFVGVDEASQLRWNQVLYLFSRLRRLVGMDCPIRFRAASNPGGRSHEEIKQRYIDTSTRADRVFISARLEDNPHLDQEEYEKSLRELDPITRARLRKGDWEISEQGTLFNREWFQIVPKAPDQAQRIRWWDIAATEKAPTVAERRAGMRTGSLATATNSAGNSAGPDWTAGVRVALDPDGIVYIENVIRGRWSPLNVEKIVSQTAEIDEKAVAIHMEQEPGASGKHVISYYSRKILAGYDFHGHRSTGPKEEYAKPLSATAEQGNVRICRGAWVPDFLDELQEFPFGAHDDQVDAASKAYAVLASKKKRAGAW